MYCYAYDVHEFATGFTCAKSTQANTARQTVKLVKRNFLLRARRCRCACTSGLDICSSKHFQVSCSLRLSYSWELSLPGRKSVIVDITDCPRCSSDYRLTMRNQQTTTCNNMHGGACAFCSLDRVLLPGRTGQTFCFETIITCNYGVV